MPNLDLPACNCQLLLLFYPHTASYSCFLKQIFVYSEIVLSFLKITAIYKLKTF